jgi:hypothetical protein
VKPYYADEWVTLFHGDCREVREWLRADVLFADPPYGMAFVSSKTKQRPPIEGDHDTTLRDEILALWGDRPAAVFGTWKIARPPSARARLIWDKSDGTGPGMGDLSFAWGSSDEEIYILGDWPKGAKRLPNVIRTAMAMGNPSGLVAQSGHPTPKPIGMVQQIMRAAPLGVIADPTAGSGWILCAAKLLGRKAIGVEIDERHCETAAEWLSQGVLDLNSGAA